ncbi:MAG: GAP family protein [Drouetiella hepatica Uher 2000/2452]|jgi:cytochrome c biogenesis protein CcdA|uniref:GAP family protein n=1 Tax=Drouetiella hepatica Uher 2000/2452 TaxID=904376 RepID=A0A951QG32_9CYAN|nr:GAP family protein [Drouetiella hepatica Uher 2000/2452]
MPSLLAYLVAIAALDSLNPTTTAIQIYLLSTPKPVPRSVSFIAGVFITYWIAGLAVTLGASQLTINLPGLPPLLMYTLQLIIGIVLLLVGWNLNKFAGDSQEAKRPAQLTIAQTFLFGSAATLWDFPTALPYLAAIERIVRSQFDLFTTMGILAIYNIIFVLPLIVLLGLYIYLGEHSTSLMHRFNRSIQKWGPRILRVLLIGLGILLIADCIAFALGHPIF